MHCHRNSRTGGQLNALSPKFLNALSPKFPVTEIPVTEIPEILHQPPHVFPNYK
jgi:hypothetical protein